MVDTAIGSYKIANHVNKIQENHGFKCEHCIQYKIELTKVTFELKSAMKIINILKEEQRINVSSVDKTATNVCNYKRGLYLQPIDENWTQETAFS
jgi:hypothetical protein